MNHSLQSDCSSCFGLCCVALPYAKSADFPLNKDGGEPCRNLLDDNRCKVHSELRTKGFCGCVSYECFGAGQHVSQSVFQGQDWRTSPELREEMFSVFPIMQQIHEMLWYLRQALSLKETEDIHSDLQNIYEATLELTRKSPKDILLIDLHHHRSNVNALLIQTSELYRKDCMNNEQRNKNKEFIGANLKGTNFHGFNFRGKMMIAANFSHANVSKADFIGADLRNADLSHANLSGAIFLTQSQINSAKGNKHTKLPSFLRRPEHWVT
ncbi:pentapeptide repeat-containing protein [Bacillus alkalicellulosilyticus]|uniref:pentapeptide repeat-containing protein n=1 Tax=Alkalihalobacterium alkalicellulosilyticum TaxID=1912214 RepID=UPI00099651C4|nr:pentapeptide repeat-containing protein [Bacillus alkalicellulosilyticus]